MSTNFSIKAIHFGTSDYQEMIDLRRKVLRIPLGLNFSEEDLNKDIHSHLIACFKDNKDIIGCCVVDDIKENTSFKLRQMAVDPLLQNNGIGTQILLFVESMAKKEKINRIHLHARKIAIPFYQKHGYEICSEEFVEVNIPHFEMEKRFNL